MTEGGKVSVRSKADNHVSWSLRGAGCSAGLNDDDDYRHAVMVLHWSCTDSQRDAVIEVVVMVFLYYPRQYHTTSTTP
jgi:hypothetical protein